MRTSYLIQDLWLIKDAFKTCENLHAFVIDRDFYLFLFISSCVGMQKAVWVWKHLSLDQNLCDRFKTIQKITKKEQN